MFGKKNQAETFLFAPELSTVMLGDDVKGAVLATLLRENHTQKHSVPYKGRRVFNKHTHTWEVELEKYKGVFLHGCYFLDDSGHYVQETSDNSWV